MASQLWSAKTVKFVIDFLESEDFKKNLVIALIGIKLWPDKITDAVKEIFEEDQELSDMDKVVDIVWIRKFNTKFIEKLSLQDSETVVRKTVTKLIQAKSSEYIESKET